MYIILLRTGVVYMAETTKPSQSQKPSRSWTPGPLTPEEIEELRRDKRETHEWNMKRLEERGVK
jgi:hypothetical protein